MKHFIRKFRAFINRSFTAACPRCHKHFYGFEGYGIHQKFKPKTGFVQHYRYVCRNCVKESIKV